MKNKVTFYSLYIFLIYIFVMCVWINLSFIHPPSTDHSAATVEQKEGIYIFIFSKPATQYDYLGSVKKTGLVMSGKPEEMFKTLLRRCKKDYPQANGIIFTSIDMDRADCIKFKE